MSAVHVSNSQNHKNEHSRELNLLQQVYLWNQLNLIKPKWDSVASSQSLIEAKIDVNPHQVSAAVFAFQNPIDGGVILADEVGLGKTIEAGLIISQLWASGKRNILIVSPKSLRHQWQDELQNLFYLRSTLINSADYKILCKNPSTDPLNSDEKIVITNEHFIAKYSKQIKLSNWDLVVIDEAHKLRNVFKKGEKQAVRAKKVREALSDVRKVLLTATPIQNSLMELYGLVSFIDPLILGSYESFRKTFAMMDFKKNPERLEELQYRMGLFFKRELRQNVREFIKYTDRHALTVRFDPTEEEELFRKGFEDYLRDDKSIAIPNKTSSLLRLLYLKLLGSSPQALKNSVYGLMKKLFLKAVALEDEEYFNSLVLKCREDLSPFDGEFEAVETRIYEGINSREYQALKRSQNTAANERLSLPDHDEKEEIQRQFEDSEVLKLQREFSQIDETEQSKENIKNELSLLQYFVQMIVETPISSKAKALTKTLRTQFEKAQSEGWPEKAVIFTEFKTTQKCILHSLKEMGLDADKDIVIFNGETGDAEERRKLVEDFRTRAKVFLTTEAGSEGLNLQFCNLIINYDLPWNPQRIEQRIGRCHRYGQKLDVVVVNFLNSKNKAEERVLELLQAKFELFEGAFGASDKVLGSIYSGTDIEREISSVYLSCRSDREITKKFQELVEIKKDIIEEKMSTALEALENSFNPKVQNVLKIDAARLNREINKIQKTLQNIVISFLKSSGVTFKLAEDQLLLDQNFKQLREGHSYTFAKKRQSDFELLHPRHEFIRGLMPDSCLEGHLYIKGANFPKYRDQKVFGGIFKIKIEGLEINEALVPLLYTEKEGLIKNIAMKDAEEILISEGRYTKTPVLDINLMYLEQMTKHFVNDQTEFMKVHQQNVYAQELNKVDNYFDDVVLQKKIEIDEIEQELKILKQELRKATFNEQKEINKQMRSLKEKQVRSEEDQIHLKKEALNHEKQAIKRLESQLELNYEVSTIAKFKITFL